MVGTKFLVQWEEHPTHLATRLGYLLEHQSLVDVTLMCNTHTLKVHRSVLAACSPYFESLLQRQLGSHPLIVLKDMKFSVLKSLVEFMYCGETSVAEENLNPLMEAAKFFEVKGLSSMTKEAISDQTSPTQNTVPSINGISSSGRGGRRPGAGRGRRTATIPMTQANPPTESAQILLSLSGNPATPQSANSAGRNMRLNPNPRLGKVVTQDGTIIDAPKSFIRNGTIVAGNNEAGTRPARGGFEPRRRGRRRNPANLMYNRNNNFAFKESEASRIAVENLKKEMDGQGDQKDESDGKLSLWNTNTIDKSPLLASLLSKAEKFESKVKNENDDSNVCESTSVIGDEETLVYQVDGEGVSSSNAKYLEALKEAGLPTDVPILIDNGDGNYVTLTEDLLMNVMEGKEEFQFQVTEGSSDVQEVGEGIVLQDGSIVMDKKHISLDYEQSKTVVSSSSVEKKVVNRPVRQFVVKEKQAKSFEAVPPVLPQKAAKEPLTKNESKKSVQDLINEAMMESLKTDSSEAELDPDAVILFEETENSKFEKYVVSSKEVNALKALNEQMQQRKKQAKDSPNVPVSPLENLGVIGGNTKIAEVKLTIGKSKSTKSILSQVLECVQGIERMKQQKLQEKTPPKVEEQVRAEVCENKSSKVKGQPQLVQLEFIDGDGERIEGYQVEGTMISQKRFGEGSAAKIGKENSSEKNYQATSADDLKDNSTNLSQELSVLDDLSSSKNDLEETTEKQFILQEEHITQKQFEEIIDESVNNTDINPKDDDMLNLLSMGNDLPENGKISDCNLVEESVTGMSNGEDEKIVQNTIKNDLLIHSYSHAEYSSCELNKNDDLLPDKSELSLEDGVINNKEDLCDGDGSEQLVSKDSLCIDDPERNIDRSLVENGLVLDDASCKPLSVEQALEVMMGDSIMKKMMKKSDIEDEDSSQQVISDDQAVLPEVVSDDSNLHLVLESENSQQEETGSTVIDQQYQVVYISEKDEMDSQNSHEIVIVEPTEEMVLGDSGKGSDMLSALVSLDTNAVEEEQDKTSSSNKKEAVLEEEEEEVDLPHLTTALDSIKTPADYEVSKTGCDAFSKEEEEEENSVSPKRRRSVTDVLLDEDGSKRLKLSDSSGEESCSEPLLTLTAEDEDEMTCDATS